MADRTGELPLPTKRKEGLGLLNGKSSAATVKNTDYVVAVFDDFTVAYAKREAYPIWTDVPLPDGKNGLDVWDIELTASGRIYVMLTNGSLVVGEMSHTPRWQYMVRSRVLDAVDSDDSGEAAAP